TIVLAPFAPIVYVGTDLGVWKSTDSGSTWTHMGPETGMPNVAVFELQINQTTNRIVAFTHGRGAFVLDITCGNGAVDSGEQCDLGANNGKAGVCCSATCQFQSAATVCR